MMSTYPICHKEDIPENGAKGFSLGARSGEIVFFVVRKNANYFAYVNSCPHTNVNLEWVPDQFLDNNNELIQCSTHGAKFTIENGFCVFGPCQGQKLKSLDIRLKVIPYSLLQTIRNNYYYFIHRVIPFISYFSCICHEIRQILALQGN